MGTKVEKRFYSVSELAVYLGVSENTIRAWKKNGEIPFHNFGRAIRFDMEKIEKWVRSKEGKIAFEAGA